jgi:hypothetical protein
VGAHPLGDLADNYAPRALKEEGGLGADNRKIWSREKKPAKRLSDLGSDGELYLPGNGRLESLKNEDVLSLYQIGNKAVRDFVATQTEFVVPKNPNWFQLDLAEQIIKANGDESLIKWPGAMTRQTATVESLAQKVSAIRKREMAITNSPTSVALLSPIDEAKAYEMKVLLQSAAA